jgi:hypothetical protein
MKYKIKIPKPSAKRLKNKRLIIKYVNGLFDSEEFIPVDCDDYFEFEFKKPLSSENNYIMHHEMEDGRWRYDFYIEFSNETRTRLEKFKVELEIT